MSKKRKIVFYGCISVIVLTVCFVLMTRYMQAQNNEVYDKLQENMHDAGSYQPQDQGTGSSSESVPEPSKEPYVSPIDFESAWEINKDIYAWIRVPGTEVDHPVVQDPSDDVYYLNHTIEGKSGLPGSIYTEPSVNRKDFSDFNTIIYGHNMRSRTMFSSLLDYRDEAFLKENREVIIYTPETEFHYKIFAAVMYSDVYLPWKFDNFLTVQNRQAFLDSIYEVRNMNSHTLDDVELTPNSKILTLSTCVGNDALANYRYLIFAVLDENYVAETPAQGGSDVSTAGTSTSAEGTPA